MAIGLTSPAATLNRQQDLPQLEQVVTVLDQLDARSVFIVADAEAYMATGAAARLQEVLGSRKTTLFTKITHPPMETAVLEGIETLRQVRPDVVLAIGGGAALDIAKVMNHLAAQIGEPAVLIRRKTGPALPGRPLIAVPTTAGSGSEATHFALMHAEDGGMHLVSHAHMRPGYVVLDPAMTATQPAVVVAATGISALALALESIWNIQANEGSIGYAQETVKLILIHLKNETLGVTNKGRVALLRAANFAGKSADLTDSTFLMALAGGLAARTGASYGQLAGALLGPMLEYNRQVGTADCADLRGPHTVQMRFVHIAQSLNVPSPADACEFRRQLLGKLQIPTHLGAFGVNPSHAHDLARALPEKLYNTNTRRLKPPQITKLITEAI